MTPEHIDTFIDRLCAYFPTQIIARNTVKTAWRRNDILLNATDQQAVKVLHKCEDLTQFPSLYTIKQFLKEVSQINRDDVQCSDCSGTGWDDGHVINEDNSETFYTKISAIDGKPERYVIPCKTCRP